MSTPNLALAHIASNQASKEITANAALDGLDRALTNLLTKAFPSDADYTLNLSAVPSEATGYLAYNFTGAITATRSVIVPVNKKLYVVQNSTTGGQAITVKTLAGTGITVGNGAGYAILYCDGTNVVSLAESTALAELLSHKDAASGYAGLTAGSLLKTAEFPALTGDVVSTAGGVTTQLKAIGAAVVVADLQAGADWGAKVQAADTLLGSAFGEIWITQAAGTSAPAADITLNSGHTLRFLHGGTWNLGSKRILIPVGAAKVSIICDTPMAVKLQYNGSDFAIVIGAAGATLTNIVTLKGLFIACQSTSDGAGCIKSLCTLFLKIEDCELAANTANKQYGILSDGTGNFCGYLMVLNCTINLCYYGIKLTGLSNSNQFIGGSITGGGSTGGWVGSIGIDFDSGDSNNVISMDIEDYDTGQRINTARNIITLGRYESTATSIAFTASASSNKVFTVHSAGTLTVTDAGTNDQVIYSDNLLALLASPAFSGNPTAPTQTALTNNTRLASTAYADAAVAVEKARALAAEAAITPNFPTVVASRSLAAQSAVDGNTAVALYTAPANGIYRVSGSVVARTLSSSAWVVLAGIVMPGGTHIGGAFSVGNVAMTTGALAGYNTIVTIPPVYLHSGDAITCGTLTSSGANTGGAFDVVWTVERLA